ncbi:hypothetical protein WJX84_006976 [Apatococcus fuscideae]|uniref:Uncharacterized protein n=1 Tax=Apatococcus fuscideae TaxID=2026836 RepID=A0AAW1T756_9CHLO
MNSEDKQSSSMSQVTPPSVKLTKDLPHATYWPPPLEDPGQDLAEITRCYFDEQHNQGLPPWLYFLQGISHEFRRIAASFPELWDFERNTRPGWLSLPAMILAHGRAPAALPVKRNQSRLCCQGPSQSASRTLVELEIHHGHKRQHQAPVATLPFLKPTRRCSSSMHRRPAATWLAHANVQSASSAELQEVRDYSQWQLDETSRGHRPLPRDRFTSRQPVSAIRAISDGTKEQPGQKISRPVTSSGRATSAAAGPIGTPHDLHKYDHLADSLVADLDRLPPETIAIVGQKLMDVSSKAYRGTAPENRKKLSCLGAVLHSTATSNGREVYIDNPDVLATLAPFLSRAHAGCAHGPGCSHAVPRADGLPHPMVLQQSCSSPGRHFTSGNGATKLRSTRPAQ